MIYKQLEDAGLNENEARIYLAALELGQTSVSRIARKSGIKRTTVYLSLENLMGKGLVSAIKKESKTHYYAEDPRNLERIMAERKEKISKLMPELLAFTNMLDKKPEIRYFEGEDGLKEVFMDSLNFDSQEILMMFSESYITDFGEQFFDDVYRPERTKRKIPARVLVPNNKEMQNISSINVKTLRQMKFLPPNLFDIKIEVMLYGKDKMSIVSFKEKFGFIIESPVIFDSFKSIFETLWSSAQ